MCVHPLSTRLRGGVAPISHRPGDPAWSRRLRPRRLRPACRGASCRPPARSRRRPRRLGLHPPAQPRGPAARHHDDVLARRVRPRSRPHGLSRKQPLPPPPPPAARLRSACARLRSRAALLLVTMMTFSLAACGPDRGLKVSPESNPSPSLFAPDSTDAGPPNEPFSLKEIRRTIEDTS